MTRLDGLYTIEAKTIIQDRQIGEPLEGFTQKGKVQLFISIFLFSAGLLLAETVLAQQICYVYSSAVNFFISAGLFLSLSLGNLLGLKSFFRKFSLVDLHIVNSLCLLIGFLSLTHLQILGLPFLLFSLVGSGLFLSQAFQRVDLKILIMGSGLGAVALYALLGTIYQVFQINLIPFTILVPLLAALALLPLKPSRIGTMVLVVSSVVTIAFFQGFSAVSRLEVSAPGLRHSQRAMATSYTPLILTDLLWSPRQEAYYLLTNGSRFSKVVSRTEGTEEDEISFDTPYLFSKPKKVLIIGSAGGANVVTALRYSPEEIVAVDINPAVFAIVNGRLHKESQGFYSDPKVRMIVSEGRNFLETTHEKFDLIVMQGVQTGTHNSIANVAVLESFLFTREALDRMWSLLNPHGSIFLEEYKSLNSDVEESGATLLGSMSAVSSEFFPENPQDHIVYFQFPQSKANAGVKNSRRFREAVVISKDSLKGQAHAVTDLFPDNNVEFLESPKRASLLQRQLLSDDNPFFARIASSSFDTPILIAGICLLLLMSLGVYYRSRKGARFTTHQGLFLMGAAYMTFVLAVVGPATLMLGQPQLAVPAIYTTLFFFGMLGGLIALRRPQWSARYGALISAGAICILPCAYYFLKQTLLSSESLVLRGGVLMILVGLMAVALELPYIGILTSIPDLRERAWGYSFGKAGVMVGMFLGIWMELHYGFSGALILAVVFYLVAAFLSFLNLRVMK